MGRTLSGECFVGSIYASILMKEDWKSACTLLGKRYVDLSGETHFQLKMVQL